MNKYFNKENKELIDIAKINAEIYNTATPFPSISFNNFFNPDFLDLVLDEFPDLSEKKSSRKHSLPTQIKFGGGEELFGPETKNLLYYLNSAPFLIFLQTLTGIDETLIGDPYFVGGGLHEHKRKGLLKVHADFNVHPTLKLNRRLNLLVYLNKNWKEEYGGHFELWNRNMTKCEKRILPAFNTMAIFSTTDFSFHGLPDPLNCPEDMSRKSIALYYYTNGRPENEVIKGQEDHSTLFQERKNIKNNTSKYIDDSIKKVISIFKK
jgi:hypothetical protein